MNYTKLILLSIIFLLVLIPVANAANSTVLTFYPNGTASDGRLGNRTTGASIEAMLLAPAGTGSVTTATPGNVSFISNASAGKVNAVTRYGMMFNTSNISRQYANWTVTNASLQLYGTAISTSAGQINMSCTQFIPASNISLVVGDYGTNKTAKCGPDLSIWSTSGYNILYFDSTGKGFVNPTGFTNVMARSRNDTESAIPVGSVAASSLSFRSSAYSGTSQDPKLVIVVNESMSIPNGSFTTSGTTGYAPKVILFNSTTTGLPDIYNWSFGDGTWGNGTDFNTSHTYSNTGTYTVFLITKNDVGSNQSANTTITLTGPNTTYIGSDTIVEYDAVGSTTWTAPTGVSSVWYLVVAGGGGGGNGTSFQAGGGGGAGGLLNGTMVVIVGTTYNVTVGAGGAVSTIGGNSSFANSTVGNGNNSKGGGNGGNGAAGGNGGSGGGAGWNLDGLNYTGGTGIAGQGYKGANSTTDSSEVYTTGGGGGSGEIGHNTTDPFGGGPGGNGTQISINGTLKYYAGGGGGYGLNNTGTGGLGGGGGGGYGDGGGNAIAATPNTGGGGGGGLVLYDIKASAGGSGVVIIRYTASNVPNASFTQNVTTGTAPTAVLFTDTSINAPTSWKWNFTNVTGNNTEVTFSTSQSPTYTFGAGNWSINLTATNAQGSNTTAPYTHWVNVSEGGGVSIPIVQWTINKQVVRVPGTVIVNDTSLNSPTSWSYYWGDGTANTTTNNATHKYTKRGVYQVTLNATNAAGSNTSVSKQVRVFGYEIYAY